MQFKNIIKNLPVLRGGWPKRDLADITDITVHHSASPSHHGAEVFAAYHTLSKRRKGKGWPAIGYHFVINPDGRIFQTLAVASWSSHNGYNNKHAVGVVLVGNFEEHPPSQEQLDALDDVIKIIRGLAPGVKYLMGHREYPKRIGRTLCPGKFFNMVPLREKHGLQRHPKSDLIHFVVSDVVTK